MNKGIGNAIRKLVSDQLPFNIIRKITTEVIMITYNGIKFYLCRNGRYMNAKAQLLHRYVWKKEVGDIPGGFVVHHIDGDQANHKITNLKMMTLGDHTRFHHKNKRVSAITRARSSKSQPTSRRVRCIETGKEYHSIAQAIRETGIGTIKLLFQSRQSTAGDYHWEEVL